MEYTIQYFIDKFEAILEDQWCTENYTNGNKHCTYGHCGMNDTEGTNESNALYKIFEYNRRSVVDTNDDEENNDLGPIPKQRILNALKSFKN